MSILESNSHAFNRPQTFKKIEGLRGIGRAVYTLFVSPPHETLHRDVADLTLGESKPLQTGIAEVVDDIKGNILQRIDPAKIRRVKGHERTYLAGILMQFTDYVPELKSYAQTPYEHVATLYDAIVDKAESTKPLTFPEQLDIALHQTGGDLTESLWRLFITSRLHARWLDGEVIGDIPPFTREEKINRMIRWQRSLAACKSGKGDIPQDASGDTYYAWTHALAAIVYDILPEQATRKTRIAACTFRNGTKIMHNIAHRYNPQTVVNDHSIASAYGNAMGEVFKEKLAG